MTSDKKIRAADGLSEGLHVALRKACDSLPTSIAWNLINAMRQPWIDYLEWLTAQLNGVQPTWQQLRDLTVNYRHDKEYKSDQFYLANALRCAFDLFTDDDWRGYASYLEYVDWP